MLFDLLQRESLLRTNAILKLSSISDLYELISATFISNDIIPFSFYSFL